MDELEKFLAEGNFETETSIKQLLQIVKDIPLEAKFPKHVIDVILSTILPLTTSSNCENWKEYVEIFEILSPKIQESQNFEMTREDIQKYTKFITQLFDENNSYWTRTWCIFVRLLGNGVRQSVFLNPLLKIVEAGFRATGSNEMQKRLESFTCWKVLLEVLIKYKELKKSKRVELIIIPLKGSKAKTLEIAEQKADIWWNLMESLEEEYENYHETLEKFICFFFGPFSTDNEPLLTYFDKDLSPAPSKMYPSVRDKAISYLGAILGQPSEAVVKLAKTQNTILSPSMQVCNKSIFEKSGKIIIAACIESVPLIAKIKCDNIEITHSIWMSLLCFFGPGNVKMYLKFLFNSLEQLQNVQKQHKTDKMLLSLVLEVATLVLSFELILQNSTNTDIEQITNYLNENAKELNENQIQRLPTKITEMCKNCSPIRRSARATATPKKDKENGKTAPEEFVVIKSVWGLNPATLTEHQQERMKTRKSDIPALYNDLSQSQSDSISIKPWTPSNVVPIERSKSLENFGNTEEETPSAINKTKLSEKKKPKKTKEIDRLKIDTVEGLAQPVSMSEKLITRRSSIARSAKDKEPDWKKSLLSGNKKEKKTSKRVNQPKKLIENEKFEPLIVTEASTDKKKSVHSPSKSPAKSPLKIAKQEPPSPTKEEEQEIRQMTPEIDPQMNSEIVEASQDVTPSVSINGRRSRLFPTLQGSPKTPIKSPEIKVVVMPISSPSRQLRSNCSPTTTDGEAVEKLNPPVKNSPEKMDTSPQNKSQDASMESRRSPRFSPKVEAKSPERPTRESARKTIDFADPEDLNLLDFMDDTPADTNQNSVIISSPDQTAEKTTEFFNDTINLSPISCKSPNQILLQERDNSNISPTLPTDNKPIRKPMQQQQQQQQMTLQIDSPKSTAPVIHGRTAHMMSMLQKQQSSTPITSKSFIMPTNESVNEMLIFSKTLPAPDASPSGSILKRKMEESLEDSASKRKRVSFHDPPVSVTKEYVPCEEEIRPIKAPINRGLLMANIAGTSSSSQMQRFKYTLKRRGKRDNSAEILNKLSQSEIMFKKPENVITKDTEQPNAEAGSFEQVVSTSQFIGSPLNESAFSFKTRAEIFDFCFSEGNFEEFLENIIENDARFSAKAIKIMTKALSNEMDSDPKVCYSILDRLSEKHSKQFLEHAIQENSTKDIIDRLSLPVVMNCLQEKINVNQQAKVELLDKLDAWFIDQNTISRQEVLNFIANCMPEKTSIDELNVLFDQMLEDKSPTEVYDILTGRIRKIIEAQHEN